MIQILLFNLVIISVEILELHSGIRRTILMVMVKMVFIDTIVTQWGWELNLNLVMVPLFVTKSFQEIDDKGLFQEPFRQINSNFAIRLSDH